MESTGPTDVAGAAPSTVGRFRIVRVLGRGGMGEVYLADDPLLDRSVALKVLTPEVANEPERRAFLRREATSAAALNHPNICTIFEVDEADGRPYIAMEAIEGRTLSSLLAEGPLDAATVLGIALQVASALEEAQERHVVHRDLKSANIMITPKGTVKVLDFGLAKRVESGPSAATQKTEWVSNADVVFGTLPYMSPEQALGRHIDHRSDLFSFGIVLYEALAAKMPFEGPTAPEVLNAVVNRDPQPIERVNPRVSPALALVVAKLLAKVPAERYQSASEVIDDLHAIQATGDLTRRRRAVARRRWRVATAVGATLVVAAAAVAWWRSHRITVANTDTVRTVVVVPATITGPSQFQFLADAIPNSLTTKLSAIGGITMKVPPTTREFSNVGGNLVRVADSYGVALCVVPRATVTSGRLTVNVQVVEPRRRDVVWSGEFESPIERYGEAVVRAADGMSVALTGRPAPPASASATPAALETALSRGQYYGNNFNTKYQKADYDLAQSAYRDALKIDARSAAAATGLAYLEIFAMQGSQSPDRALPELDAWARRAIDFDPQYPLAWAALAVAENWRPKPDPSKQLECGFHAASLGEGCGACQLALMEGIMQFSQVLAHHTAQHEVEIAPLSAYGHLNSAVALTALGRSDEASAAIARAAAIDPEARWVAVLRTFTEAASGSLPSAAAGADALAAESLKSMPTWVASFLELIRALAKADEHEIARDVDRVRVPVRLGRASLVELYFVAAVAVPMLARSGHADAALTILADVSAAGAPPPYDVVVMNPFLKRLMDDPRAREIVSRSRAHFDVLLEAIRQAKSAGRFPLYLDRPLQDLLSALRDSRER